MSAANQHYRQQEEKRQKREAAQRAKAAMAGRDPGAFIAWLKPVQQSPGWLRASHTARSLLMDIIHSGMNGRLSASMKYLKPFGWNSTDTVTRAVAELIACGLLVQTRRGACPNQPAWYACTWLKLQHIEGLDVDPKTFKTGGYMTPAASERRPHRARTAAATKARRRNAIIRADGYTPAPSDGDMDRHHCTVARSNAEGYAPSDGAWAAKSGAPISPSDGAYLDIAIPMKQTAAGERGMARLLRLAKPTVQLDAYRAARTALQVECDSRYPDQLGQRCAITPKLAGGSK